MSTVHTKFNAGDKVRVINNKEAGNHTDKIGRLTTVVWYPITSPRPQCETSFGAGYVYEHRLELAKSDLDWEVGAEYVTRNGRKVVVTSIKEAPPSDTSEDIEGSNYPIQGRLFYATGNSYEASWYWDGQYNRRCGTNIWDIVGPWVEPQEASPLPAKTEEAQEVSMSKEYCTRAGAKVRLYSTNGSASHPIHGAIEGEAGFYPAGWTRTGKYYIDGAVSDYDLIEVKPRIQRTVWLNLYKDGLVVLHYSKEHADKAANRRVGFFKCKEIKIDEVIE